MKRIFVVTEGQSETNFVKRVMVPYFSGKCILVPNTVTTKIDNKHGKMYKGGVGNYGQIKNTLSRTLACACKDKNSYVTTMFDFYRLPSDVPGTTESASIMDPYGKVECIEKKIQKEEGFDDIFFFPYIELHEFEAMLFSDLEKLKETYFEYDLTVLEECVKKQGNPELINGGSETAPSKRILKCIKTFDKANVGVDVLAKIGVENIAKKCCHFSEWIKNIEMRIS